MVTQQLAQPSVGEPLHGPHGGVAGGAKISTTRRLAFLRDDIASLRRESVVALSRWYQYRKAVRELSRLEDYALSNIGIDRSEIEITAYCLAEQTMSARPRCKPEGGHHRSACTIRRDAL